MVWFRLAMGFVLLADARDGHTGWTFVIGLLAALLSDIFDGVLARKTASATVALRRADSWVDAMFFVLLATAAWLAHREVLLAHSPLLVTMLVLFFLSQLPSFIRFGQAAAFHAYSAKAMGLAFIPAGILLFGLGQGGWPLDLALLVAIISHIDRALIALTLPAWQTDVVWFGEALRIRREARR
jgi:CDP-diacylglycerol--glycerol-3-phosphate 3-phosphatidyltransferase